MLSYEGVETSFKMITQVIPHFLKKGGTTLCTFHAEVEYDNVRAFVELMNSITTEKSDENKFFLSKLESSQKSNIKAGFFTSKKQTTEVGLDGLSALMTVASLTPQELEALTSMPLPSELTRPRAGLGRR